MANPLIDLYQQASQGGDLNDPTSQQWLDYFSQQGMTQGLGLNDKGQAGFSGPVAGYAGPLRPGDAPYSNASLGLPENVVPVINGAMTPQGSPSYSPDTMQQIQQQTMGNLQQKNPQLADALRFLGMVPRGTSPDVQAGLMNQIAPGLVPDSRMEDFAAKERIRQRDAQERRDQADLNTAMNNIGVYYNKKTGKPASEDFVDRAPTLAELRTNYVPLKTADQRNDLQNINTLDNSIQEYENLLPKLPLPKEPGIVGTTAGKLAMTYGDYAGDPVVREWQALQGRLISLARTFGGTSKSADSEREVKRLEAVVTRAGDSIPGAQAALRQLKIFRDSRARTLPIPGLQHRYRNLDAPVAAPRETTVRLRAPDGSEREVPANRVDEFLQRGATRIGGQNG